MFDGMRPGEILAIQLGKISEHSVLIDKRVYKGDVDTPTGRKGKRTSRTVGLLPVTVADWQCGEPFCSKPDRKHTCFRPSGRPPCGTTTSGGATCNRHWSGSDWAGHIPGSGGGRTPAFRTR